MEYIVVDDCVCEEGNIEFDVLAVGRYCNSIDSQHHTRK